MTTTKTLNYCFLVSLNRCCVHGFARVGGGDGDAQITLKNFDTPFTIFDNPTKTKIEEGYYFRC